MRVIDRLLKYLDHRRMTPYAFERSCGIANGYLKKQLKGKGTVGSEILEKILEKYRDLSLTWLITGKGEMITETYPPAPDISNKVQEDQPPYASQKEVIDLLRQKISILEQALADKDKIIRMLEADN